jgi:hypothetical protein
MMKDLLKVYAYVMSLGSICPECIFISKDTYHRLYSDNEYCELKYNSNCPRCNAPAYLGLQQLECSRDCHLSIGINNETIEEVKKMIDDILYKYKIQKE